MAIQPPRMSKARARSVRRQARALNSTTDIDHLRSLMAEHLPPPPARIAIYRSYGVEPRTHELISMLTADGYRVLCPRMGVPTGSGDIQDAMHNDIHNDIHMEWVEVSEDTVWQSGFQGIDEPVGPTTNLVVTAAVIVPALAATTQGERLGQGGGHYDRALAEIARHHSGGPLLIGLVFADEVCTHADWPVEEHDVLLDVVVGVRHS